MLQKHNAKASVMASMIVAAGAYVAGAVDALTVDYANIDGGDLKPKLTWEGTTAVDIERAESDQGPWTKLDTASAGTTTWTDTSTVVSKTYWYRLNDGSSTSDPQKFIAVRKLNTDGYAKFTDGNTGTEASAFDGSVDTRPDVGVKLPRIGVDFGEATNYVAYVRFYPRKDWYSQRLSFLRLFGSSSRDSEGTQVSDGKLGEVEGYRSENPDDKSMYRWYGLDVASSTPYRCYYAYKTQDMSGDKGDFYGNVSEIELYGWSASDIPDDPEEAVCPDAEYDWYFRGETGHMSYVFNERFASGRPRYVVVGTIKQDGFGRIAGSNDPFSYVVWNAAASSGSDVNGLAGSGQLRIADWEEGEPATGQNFGALKIESGDYAFAGIHVGETGKGHFWVAGGRVYASEDFCVSMSDGGEAIIGQDSGDPAVVEVKGEKWVFLAQNAGTPGSLTIKKTGTLYTSCIACEHPAGSSLVLDGGTLVRNANNPSNHDFVKDFYKNGADTPITLTANGGTIQANVETLITPRVVCADGVSSAVLTKTGTSDVTLSGELGEGVGVKAANGNLKIRDGLYVASLEVAQGAKFIVDFTDEAMAGKGEYSPVRAGGTFTIPDGAKLTDYVGYVAPAGLDITLELKDGRPVFTASVNASAEAKIGETRYALLANAAEAATEGQTVELLKDCLLFNAVTFTGANVTLDLAGNTLKRSAGGGCISFSQGGVVSNGTFTTMLGRETMGDSLLAVGDGKSLLVENVTIGSEGSEIYNVFTGWLIDGPNIPGRPFWVMRHRTPLLT